MKDDVILVQISSNFSFGVVFIILQENLISNDTIKDIVIKQGVSEEPEQQSEETAEKESNPAVEDNAVDTSVNVDDGLDEAEALPKKSDSDIRQKASFPETEDADKDPEEILPKTLDISLEEVAQQNEVANQPQSVKEVYAQQESSTSKLLTSEQVAETTEVSLDELRSSEESDVNIQPAITELSQLEVTSTEIKEIENEKV